MGKPTGFLETTRQTSKKRAPIERIKDWDEFVVPASDEQVEEQASRCMDCGTPFCHTGMDLEGSTSGCPVHNKIPDFNDLVYHKQWKAALENLLETNNFPEFTGRVCPAPCEGSCVLGINQPPVTIKEIEYSIIEKGFAEGWIKPRPPKYRTGKKVAVIGSGPAGLAAADQLNKKGHWVTVFEKSDTPGGLLMYGIPNMKLDKEVVLRRIRLMESEGVSFVMNAEIGSNYSHMKILKEFDSTILCCGAGKPRDLNIEGRGLKGIHFAMDFLTQSTQLLQGKIDSLDPEFNAEGKNVVVIGGGDTGTDCIGTSIRQGCKNLEQLEILPKPPEQRAENNPWPQWPKEYYLDYGQQEAKDLYGEDPRSYQTMSLKFNGNEEGRVTEVVTKEIKWKKTEYGKWESKEVRGTERRIPADLVLLAMGYVGPEPKILELFGITLQGPDHHNVHDRYRTDIRGVFTAGDMRRGQSLVVWAIQEGREVAEACDIFLQEVKA